MQDLENEGYYLIYNLNEIQNADFKIFVRNYGVLNEIGRKADRWRYHPEIKIANEIE